MARKTSVTQIEATHLPITMSAGDKRVVCSVASTPCSRSELMLVAVNDGTMSIDSPSTKKVVRSYIERPALSVWMAPSRSW